MHVIRWTGNDGCESLGDWKAVAIPCGIQEDSLLAFPGKAELKIHDRPDFVDTGFEFDRTPFGTCGMEWTVEFQSDRLGELWSAFFHDHHLGDFRTVRPSNCCRIGLGLALLFCDSS